MEKAQIFPKEDLPFVGNFIYDGAVIGYEFFKEEAQRNKVEPEWDFLFRMLKYSWPKEKTCEIIKDISIHIGSASSFQPSEWNKILTFTSVNKLPLLKIAALFQQKGQTIGWDEEFFKSFLFPSHFEDWHKKIKKASEGKPQLLDKLNDFELYYEKETNSLFYKGQLPPVDKEAWLTVKPHYTFYKPSSNNISLYVKCSPFDYILKEKEQSPQIAGMTVSTSYIELFPSAKNEPYKYFTPSFSSKGKTAKAFDRIWPFYGNAFTYINRRNIFIHHPDKEVSFIANRQLKKLVEKDVPNPIAKALIRAYHRHIIKGRHEQFTLVIRGNISPTTQKADEYYTLYIPEALEEFARRFSSILDARIHIIGEGKGTRSEYLFLLLSRMSPATLARHYSIVVLPRLKTIYESELLTLHTLLLYQMFLEDYYSSASTPFELAKAHPPIQYQPWEPRQLTQLFTTEEDQVLLTFLRSLDRGAFISYATKKILEEGRNKEALLYELSRLMEYKEAWIPFLAYVLLKVVKNGRKN